MSSETNSVKLLDASRVEKVAIRLRKVSFTRSLSVPSPSSACEEESLGLKPPRVTVSDFSSHHPGLHSQGIMANALSMAAIPSGSAIDEEIDMGDAETVNEVTLDDVEDFKRETSCKLLGHHKDRIYSSFDLTKLPPVNYNKRFRFER